MVFLIISFAWGFGISFLGSIPPGAISMATVEAAIKENRMVAASLACGAAFVELFQAIIATRFSVLILQNPDVGSWFTWLSIPLFTGIALYYFLKKPTTEQGLEEWSQRDQSRARRRGFLSGVLISALNMLAIPFWVFYATYLSEMGWLDIQSWPAVFVFAFGVALGTFITLLAYAWMGIWAKRKAPNIDRWASRVVGIAFLSLAIFQLSTLF